MSVRLFLQIDQRHSIPLEYFVTLCGVPVAENSYWSSKHKYAASRDLKNPPANRKQARVIFLTVTSVLHVIFLKSLQHITQAKIFMSYQ